MVFYSSWVFTNVESNNLGNPNSIVYDHLDSLLFVTSNDHFQSRIIVEDIYGKRAKINLLCRSQFYPRTIVLKLKTILDNRNNIILVGSVLDRIWNEIFDLKKTIYDVNIVVVGNHIPETRMLM